MNKAFSLADATQGDAKVQLDNGKSVEDQIISHKKTFLQLIDTGNKILFIKDFNRKINMTNVRQLKKSVENTGHFLLPIIVMSATEYLTFYPEAILYDPMKENEYSKISSDLDSSYVILDGQHRVITYKELLADKNSSQKPDLSVEVISLLEEGMTPHDYLYTINTVGHSWTDKDRTQYIVASTKDKETGISVAQEWQKKYGMGIRNATAIIQFNDGYKANMQKSFMCNKKLDPFLESTPDNIKRGKELFRSFAIGFRETPKLMKNMAPILAVIQCYTSTSDPEKVRFTEKICKFFKTIDQKNTERIASLRTKEDIETELIQLWKEFDEKYTNQTVFRNNIDIKVNELDKEFPTPPFPVTKKRTSPKNMPVI